MGELQKIPAHLNASDEELYLFLRNPPSPPIPFYPSSIHFKQTPSMDHRHKTKKNVTSPKKQGSPAREYRKIHRNKHRTSPNKSGTKNRPYFAAPNKIKDVTISYSMHNDNDIVHNEEKKEPLQIDDDNNNDNSLSVSNENHIKYTKKK